MKQLLGDAAKYVDSKPVDDIILGETTLGILSIMGDIAGDEKPHLKEKIVSDRAGGGQEWEQEIRPDIKNLRTRRRRKWVRNE